MKTSYNITKMSVKNMHNPFQSYASPKHTIRLCQNHNDRPATHQLILSDAHHYPSDDCFFCEKCSIMLASQGFNVIKLASHPNYAISYKDSNSKKIIHQPIGRRAQIQSFINKVSTQIDELLSTDQYVSEYLVQAEDYYGNIMRDVSEYFKRMQQVLQINKYKVYNTLLNNRVKGEEEARAYRDLLNESKESLIGMIQDIEENMETVETTSHDMFSTIMMGYEQKLNEIFEISQNPPQLKQLTFSLKIPDFPKQLQNISKAFILFYPELRTMPSSHASCQLKPSDHYPSLQNLDTHHNTQHHTQNNSLIQNIPFQNDKTLSLEQSHEEFDNEKEQSLKQNNKNVINMDEEERKSFGGSLGFSFEESDDNCISDKDEYRLKTYEKQNESEMDYSDYAVPAQARLIQELTKISGHKYKESESLGKYLNLSQSREASIEDTETLLII